MSKFAAALLMILGVGMLAAVIPALDLMENAFRKGGFLITASFLFLLVACGVICIVMSIRIARQRH